METIRKPRPDREGLIAIMVDQPGNPEPYINGVRTKPGTPIFRRSGTDTFVLPYGDREIGIEIPDWNEDFPFERIAAGFNAETKKTAK